MNHTPLQISDSTPDSYLTHRPVLIEAPYDGFWNPIIAVGRYGNDKNAEDLAAFIVQAVNSHAALVAENKRLREALADSGKCSL